MKQINLAEWAIKHKQIVYFFIFFILLGGIMSYFSLGRSEDPAFTLKFASGLGGDLKVMARDSGGLEFTGQLSASSGARIAAASR